MAEVQVTVRYFAAARAAAGRAEQRFSVEPGTTIQRLLDLVERDLPDAGTGRQVIARCSVLHNGESGGAGSDAGLDDGDVVDLLPPFAGG